MTWRRASALALILLLPATARAGKIIGTVRELNGIANPELSGFTVQAFVGATVVGTGRQVGASGYEIDTNEAMLNPEDVRVTLSFRGNGLDPVDVVVPGKTLDPTTIQIFDPVMP